MIKEAANLAMCKCASGLSMEAAVEVAVEEELARRRNAGMGQSAIEAVHEAVSPWLWVLSVAGFGMALINTRRIKKMYGSWRAARAAHR
jgi:hypothetical protein